MARELAQFVEAVLIVLSRNSKLIVSSKVYAAIKSLHVYVELMGLLAGQSINIFKAQKEVTVERAKAISIACPISIEALGPIDPLLYYGPSRTHDLGVAQHMKIIIVREGKFVDI